MREMANYRIIVNYMGSSESSEAGQRKFASVEKAPAIPDDNANIQQQPLKSIENLTNPVENTNNKQQRGSKTKLKKAKDIPSLKESTGDQFEDIGGESAKKKEEQPVVIEKLQEM
jgi:hypothetical protein